MKKILTLICSLFLIAGLLTGCSQGSSSANPSGTAAAVTLSSVPQYTNQPYVAINNNKPGFTEADLTDKSFEKYSPLDRLGRCGAAFANISKDTMPKEKRGKIGQVKPSGWQTAKYDSVDGKYLFNRCHLIGFQLSAENANERNLITGTRYMNVEGMLPFENMVADYVKETGNHVLYRVTPLFTGNNLVADGVQMEAMSVEDKGEGISFNVFCYNVQPGIDIDYANGHSRMSGKAAASGGKPVVCAAGEDFMINDYVLNNNSRKFHKPTCSGAMQISDKYRENYKGSRAELISKGYTSCNMCKP